MTKMSADDLFRQAAEAEGGMPQLPLDECHLFPTLPRDTNPLRGGGDQPIPVRTSRELLV